MLTMPLPRIRLVPTGSGATAVQIIWRYHQRRPILDHIGSAHTDHELELLKLKAQRLIDGNQLALDYPTTPPMSPTGTPEAPLAVASQRAGYLLDAITTIYHDIGLDQATCGDEIFKNLVIARIIHPGSKLDSIETLAEVGVTSASYRTITRALPKYATASFQAALTKQLASFARIGPGVLVLYDVTTLYFETDTADELRKPGFSKERRLEPQVTVGLLTDGQGFPLAVHAFEGNKGETTTMIPVIEAFRAAYGLERITVVADAGMFSESNKKSLVEAGLDYILGVKFRQLPYPVEVWRKDNPGAEYSDGQIWCHKNRGGGGPDGVPIAITYYQYSSSRARRSIKGIDEQVAKAEKAVAGTIAIKRNRYVDLRAPRKRVNHELAEKHRWLAGIKGYETSRVDLSAEEVIAAYRRLLKIEKSFRMSKSDLKARPVFAHKAESIHAHLAVVMAAMAVGHKLEQASGLSLKRVVRTLRKYQTFTLEIGGQTVYAATEVPVQVRDLLDRLGVGSGMSD